MKINIFDVEHGACALVTSPNNNYMLIDCGNNNNSGWRPSTYLPGKDIHTIRSFVVTNYDEDHVSDLANLRQQKQITIQALCRNKSISPADIKNLKSEDGMGPGIDALCKMAEEYCHPANPIDWGGLKTACYHNYYPTDFDDENNLSLAYFLSFQGLKIIFPGDLEKVGWEKLLEREEFRNELREVNVFVASHHGRENGCCEDVFNYCHPDIIIISDKQKGYQTQETVNWYASKAKGIPYASGTRKVFTTRSDGNISLSSNLYSFIINTDKNLSFDVIPDTLGPWTLY